MSENNKSSKSSRKPRSTYSGKKKCGDKIFNQFQSFAKDLRQKHAGQIKLCKEMREMLVELRKNFTPTEDEDIVQFNNWIKYNNKKLKYQPDFKALVPLETDEIQPIELFPVSNTTTTTTDKQVSEFLPDILTTVDTETRKTEDVQSDCDEDLGFS
tara:strand:+ start:58 stop:525 length:468 start_codon:yes stop_codon:yes gene_type:complete